MEFGVLTMENGRPLFRFLRHAEVETLLKTVEAEKGEEGESSSSSSTQPAGAASAYSA